MAKSNDSVRLEAAEKILEGLSISLGDVKTNREDGAERERIAVVLALLRSARVELRECLPRG